MLALLCGEVSSKGGKNAEDLCLQSTRGFPNALIKYVYLEVLNS